MISRDPKEFLGRFALEFAMTRLEINGLGPAYFPRQIKHPGRTAAVETTADKNERFVGPAQSARVVFEPGAAQIRVPAGYVERIHFSLR